MRKSADKQRYKSSKIYVGEVSHARLKPIKNIFKYPLPFFAFNLNALEDLDKELPLFSYNKKNVVSLYDADYVKGFGTIYEKVLKLLEDKPYQKEITHIFLVTNPRYFNYIFNPVSFFYCYNADDEVVCIIAEVNNTFHERHFYILDQENKVPDQNVWVFGKRKAFHVSPFNDMEGTYIFSFTEIAESIKIQILLNKEEEPFLFAQLKGRSQKLNHTNLRALLLRKPMTAMLNYPRILQQAANLYLRKGLNVYVKPVLSNPMSMTVKEIGAKEKFAMNKVFAFLEKFEEGKIIMTLPDHQEKVFGDPKSEKVVRMHVYEYLFFWNLVKYGDIAFGEGYTKKLWDCDDLTGVLEIFIDNRPYANEQEFSRRSFSRITNRLQHLLNHNSIKNSAKNIEAHYDLSNEFFESFLDPSMMYSSAIFKNCEEDLESAQYRKVHRMIDTAQIRPGDHVLEIGSGWGTLAVEAVKKTGCKVTTITLSKEQQKLVQERIKKEGLEDHISVEIRDYRLMEGQFDKIISIEMFEAVGHENFETFFKSLDRLLKPDGLIAMQVITIADENYESYKNGVDWIQKYIFPGGHVPSLSAITEAMQKSSPFMMEHLENFGIHYAETLRRWRERFKDNEEHIAELGFDEEFRRIWEYYLCYCEAGFNKRVLGLLQFVMTRPNNRCLPDKV